MVKRRQPKLDSGPPSHPKPGSISKATISFLISFLGTDPHEVHKSQRAYKLEVTSGAHGLPPSHVQS
jgi:hypothetical protein